MRAVKSILETYSHALVVFHYKNTKDVEWRFTYMHKSASQKDSTQTKRYTYLCGKGHPSHTVAKNFITIKNSEFADKDYLTAFNEGELSKEFYEKLFEWYEWAMPQCTFPQDSEIPEKEENKLIRLITRLMFVWFIKQKDLVPSKLFDTDYLKTILRNFDENSKKNGNYYNAILQNLFFATLNREITDEDGNHRAFATAQGTRDDKNLYRYEEMFTIKKDKIIELFDTVPFLNGGLFECLDREKSTHRQKIHYDGFSRNDEKSKGVYLHRAFIPNCVFFDNQKGIIKLLEQYNFTVEEGSPLDVQVSLDPELLGNVFENLLGAWNPETQETVRSSTGSFYTPREIVQYMVDQSLVSYLEENGIKESKIIESFFTTGDEKPLSEIKQTEKKAIIDTLLKVKILDPACGSGAFPVGCLNRMVELICAIDNSTDTYELKKKIIANNLYGIDIQTFAVQITKLRFFISLICEQEKTNDKKNNYGIKPLPNLETKFIAANTLVGIQNNLIGDFDTHLKEKFDTLLEIREEHIFNAKRNRKKELIQKDESLSEEIINMIRAGQKIASETEIKELEKIINKTKTDISKTPAKIVTKSPNLFGEVEEIVVDKLGDLKKQLKKQEKDLEKIKKPIKNANFGQVEQLAKWSPYDQNVSSSFFDSFWMFGLLPDKAKIKKTFDIVIANPPYIDSENMTNQHQEAFRDYLKNKYNLVGNWDIYIAFFEFALANSNIVSFITPDKWLSRDFGRSLRENKVRTRLLKIVHAGADIFDSVRVDAIITLFIKQSEKLTAYKFLKGRQLVKMNEANVKNLQEPYLIDYLFTKNNQFIIDMDKLSMKFTDLGVECEGACATNDPYKLDSMIKNMKSYDNTKYYKIINTGTISKYHDRWGEKEMTHFGQKTLYPVVLKNAFEQNFGSTYVSRAKSPKVIFKGMNLLDAVIDFNAEIVPYKTTLVVCSKDKNLLKFVCALLNSKLVLKYIKVKYASSSYCGGTTFTKDMINYLPLPELTNETETKLIKLVDKVIKAKQSDSHANTSKDEDELNEIIYSIYGIIDQADKDMIEEK